MNIPTQDECFQLIHQMDMMDHIIDHSIMVGNVALCLCQFLKKKFPSINIDLVTSAALLHDITKTRSFATGEMHPETGCHLLVRLGYPEIGDIVRQHVILDLGMNANLVSEPEIVNYADKRVLHDRIVSLSERMDYILEKYGTSPERRERIVRLAGQSRDLEQRICRYSCFFPDDIDSRIELQKGSSPKP